MNNETLAASIAEWLKDHQYTCLTEANGVEVWRCQKPGSCNLAFDIVITRFGIAMFGDVGTLVFKVGASYGLPFLARKPDGYMLEKLETQFRAEREFDQPGFLERICFSICERLTLWCEEGVELPEWITDERQRRGKFNELVEWMDEHIEAMGDDEVLDFHEIQSALAEACNIEDLRAAEDFMEANEEVLGESDTYEWDLTMPSSSLVRRLHYVSHAARAILAQQEAQAGLQVAQ